MLTKIGIFFGGLRDTLAHIFWMFQIMVSTLILTVASTFVAFLLGIKAAFKSGFKELELGLAQAQEKADEMSKTIKDTISGIFS